MNMLYLVQFLVCLTLLGLQVTQADGEVRLINGKTPHDGIVQTLYNGTWRTAWAYWHKKYSFCTWDLQYSFVICRTLNYSKAVSGGCSPIDTNDTYPGASIFCKGRGIEQDVNECTVEPYPSSKKLNPQWQAATVSCGNFTKDEKDIQVRLVGEDKSNYGIVEVLYQGVWRRMLGNMAYEWDVKSASVICRMLGYKAAVNELYYPFHKKINSSSTILEGVVCNGNESSIVECAYKSWWHQGNYTSYYAGAFCQEPQKPPPVQLRLTGGSRPNIGQVELRYHGVWGTICDHRVSTIACDVICRMLGYLGANNKLFIDGPKRNITWLYGITCNGSEESILQCSHREFGRAMWLCGQGSNLDISCKVASPPRFTLSGCGPQLTVNRTGMSVKEKQLITFYELFIFKYYYGYTEMSFKVPGDITTITIGDGHVLEPSDKLLTFGTKYWIKLRAIFKESNGKFSHGQGSKRFPFTVTACLAFKESPPRFTLGGCGPQLSITRIGMSEQEKQLIAFYRISIYPSASYYVTHYQIPGNFSLLMIGDGNILKPGHMSLEIGTKNAISLRAGFKDENGKVSYGRESARVLFTTTSCLTTKGPSTTKSAVIPTRSAQKSLGTGAVVGIVIGVVLVIAMVVVLVYLLIKRNTNRGYTAPQFELSSNQNPKA